MSEYSPRACIPTGPIVDRIHQWVEAHQTIVRNDGKLAGGAEVCMEKCGINISTLERQKMMTFDTADRVLCKLGYEQDWYFHPVLAPIYASLRLRPNEQDILIAGGSKERARLANRRKYWKTANEKRARLRATNKQPHYRAALKQRSEQYDVLEAEQAAA